MKAALIFTGSGPIVILTTTRLPDRPGPRREARGPRGFGSSSRSRSRSKSVRAKYHAHYDHVLLDLKQEDDLRVVDEDGHHVYAEFSLRDLGAPIAWEP